MIKKFFIKGRALLLTTAFLGITAFGNVNVFASTAYTGMRDISPLQVVKEMKVGWNLGNTFDAGNETDWGNPVTTHAMIDKVKAAGFNTIRIPVTWRLHIGSAPNYTIDSAYLKRVEEVVNYAFDNNMYVIINVHHDDPWIVPTYAHQDSTIDELTKVWTQISNYFKNYSDYLIFETLNEPRPVGASNEWSGGSYENRDVINKFNLAAVNAIRRTGGNNSNRFLMVPTLAAAAMPVTLNDYIIPNNDSKVIVSLHMYSPYSFCGDINGTSYWGSDSDKAQLDSELNAVYDKFVRNGRAVVIGEMGTINKNNLSSRVAWTKYYVQAAKAKGITSIWWDNGISTPGQKESFAILNRSGLSWISPEIVNAIMEGAGSGPIKFVYGDLNGDNTINSVDVALMQRYVLKIITSFPINDGFKAADLNGDGTINTIDYALLKRFSLHSISKFPVDI